MNTNMTLRKEKVMATAGWYADPEGSGRQRYWDGMRWTDALALDREAVSGVRGYGAGRAGVVAWLGISIALLAIGVFGPWASVSAAFIGTVNRTGIDTTDGTILLIAAGVLLVLALLFAFRIKPIAVRLVALSLTAVIGIGASIVAIYDLVDASNRLSGVGHHTGVAMASIGWGLWLAAIAAISLTIASVVALAARRVR